MHYDLSIVADWGANAQLAESVSLIENINASTESLKEMLVELEGEVTNEGLASMVGSINDVVLRLYNNFKAVVLKGGKRSELKYFYESNVSAVKRVEGKPIEEYADVEVDFPTGMRGTYADGTLAISAVYSALDMLQCVKEALKASDVILSSMSKGSDAHESVVALADKVNSTQLKKQNIEIAKLKKVFTGKGTGKARVKLSKLFGVMDDVKSCRMTLVALEQNLLDGPVINNRVQSMHESTGLAVDFIKNSLDSTDPEAYVPTKDFIRGYSDYIKNIAIALGNYGETMVAHMAIEHNMALVYTKMMDV